MHPVRTELVPAPAAADRQPPGCVSHVRLAAAAVRVPRLRPLPAQLRHRAALLLPGDDLLVVEIIIGSTS